MCKRTWKEPIRQGRPAAFCTPTCRAESKTTRARFCRICTKPFVIGPTNDNNPFYCTPECQEKTLCHHDFKPCDKRTRFCTIACMEAEYPPPYTCKNPDCKRRKFPGSGYFLSKKAALIGPPKYCSSDCYEAVKTWKPGETSRGKTASIIKEFEFDSAMQAIQPTSTPYGLPARKNGQPWVGMTPPIPRKQLHPRAKNTLLFWDTAINGYLDDLNEIEYNAFLFEFVCKGSILSGPIMIQECWHLWPYLEPLLDEARYSPTMFEAFAGRYVSIKRSICKNEGCLTDAQLDERVMQCVSASKLDHLHMIAKTPSQRRFAEAWIRPMGFIDAPYDAPHTMPVRKGTLSRIQVEIQKSYRAKALMENKKHRLSYLSPLTGEQYDRIAEMAATIRAMAYAACYEPKAMAKGKFVPNTRPWPWGPNRYTALVEAHSSTDLDDVKADMLGTPQYNLPEKTLDND